jgi:hypothetical protein
MVKAIPDTAERLPDTLPAQTEKTDGMTLVTGIRKKLLSKTSDGGTKENPPTEPHAERPPTDGTAPTLMVETREDATTNQTDSTAQMTTETRATAERSEVTSPAQTTTDSIDMTGPRRMLPLKSSDGGRRDPPFNAERPLMASTALTPMATTKENAERSTTDGNAPTMTVTKPTAEDSTDTSPAQTTIDSMTMVTGMPKLLLPLNSDGGTNKPRPTAERTPGATIPAPTTTVETREDARRSTAE